MFQNHVLITKAKPKQQRNRFEETIVSSKEGQLSRPIRKSTCNRKQITSESERSRTFLNWRKRWQAKSKRKGQKSKSKCAKAKMADHWQNVTPLKGSGFGKVQVRLAWYGPNGLQSEVVPCTRLEAVLLWDVELVPLNSETKEIMKRTRLKVALFGKKAPEEHRNEDIRLLSFLGGPSTYPIAMMFCTVRFWRGLDNRIYVQDGTKYKSG